jgi:hypothetical protein
MSNIFLDKDIQKEIDMLFNDMNMCAKYRKTVWQSDGTDRIFKFLI